MRRVLKYIRTNQIKKICELIIKLDITTYFFLDFYMKISLIFYEFIMNSIILTIHTKNL